MKQTGIGKPFFDYNYTARISSGHGEMGSDIT